MIYFLNHIPEAEKKSICVTIQQNVIQNVQQVLIH